MNILKRLLFPFLIILLTSITFLPLSHSGFFAFHDNAQVERVFEMNIALVDKSFPVRWVPDLGYGYGYPIFNFYGPLPYYLGGIIMFAGFDALLATKIMFGIGILISGVAMFYLTKRHFGTAAGVASAVVYAYFPYHAVNIYVRGAVDEFFAYAFMPLVLLGLFQLFDLKKTKLISRSSVKLILSLSLGIFLVAVSHNLSIFMLLILLVPYVLVSIFLTEQKRKFLIILIVSVTIGMALSSFYILPAFLEMSHTNIASQVGGGANFADHFVCPQQLWDSMWGFGGSVKGCVDGLSFRLGKINILFVSASLLIYGYALLRKKINLKDRIAGICVVMFLISIFLTLDLSTSVWQTVPFMKYIQYPWRFLNFVALFMSFIVGFLVYKTQEFWGRKLSIILTFCLILFTIAFNYKLFVPQKFNDFSIDYYTSNSHIVFDTSKISDEYMPSGFQTPRVVSELPTSKVELLKTTGNIRVLNDKTNYLKASYLVLGDGVVHVNTAYFPGWKAYVNGQNLPIVPTPKGMNISIPKGEGTFEMKLTQTATEMTGNVLTILAFFALLIGIIKTSLPRK